MLTERLREGLRAAIKARDRVAVTALRSALAAIENAEAVEVSGAARRGSRLRSVPRWAARKSSGAC